MPSSRWRSDVSNTVAMFNDRRTLDIFLHGVRIIDLFMPSSAEATDMQGLA